MNGSKISIKFNYLYCDAGNYKRYGSVVYTNHTNISLIKIENTIRENLIDGEYFIADEWQVPSLFFETSNPDDHHWHEFSNVELTEDIATSILDIKEFISQLLSPTANRSSVY